MTREEFANLLSDFTLTQDYLARPKGSRAKQS